jgi:MFS family permease
MSEHLRPALGGRTAWLVLTVGQFAAVIAMLQRSSLGVAATDALDRFGIAAATLATFTVLQLLVYAALQVPVGVLIDRYGSKRLIVAGSLVMAGAQAMFAFARALPLAYAARALLGAGDALTFISVMRLVPAWFPPPARLGSAIGLVNVGGFAGTLIAVFAVGLVLQLAAPGGSTDYPLSAFKWAFSTQYVLWAVGIVQTLRYRRRVERLLAERDPEALEALRRGVQLPPPG